MRLATDVGTNDNHHLPSMYGSIFIVPTFANRNQPNVGSEIYHTWMAGESHPPVMWLLESSFSKS